MTYDKKAKKIYDTMVSALNKADWKFDERKSDLLIVSNYGNEDFQIDFLMEVDAIREVVRLFAPLSFKVPADKRLDAAVAAAVANYGMVNGSFDLDIKSGELSFRLTTSYCGCEIGEKFFLGAISTAMSTVAAYYLRFLSLSTGEIDLQRFIELEK